MSTDPTQRIFIDPADTAHYKASLLNAIVAPRPIGWISTMAADGSLNLAPYSYFGGVSATPPMVVFTANAPADRNEKDTLANVRESGEFVANFASYALREAVNLSSAPAPHGISEFEIAGLSAIAGTRIRTPGVAESPARLECTLVRIVDLPPQVPAERHAALVIGRVVGIDLAAALVDANGRFDTFAAQPIARMGGFDYATLGEVFEMLRPAWPASDDKP